LDERGHVVLRDLLELVDAVDRERGLLLDVAEVLLGDVVEARPSLAREDLDPEPVLESRLVGPDGGHLGERVPRDHAVLLKASGPRRGRP
jgi:hypothetical protein